MLNEARFQKYIAEKGIVAFSPAAFDLMETIVEKLIKNIMGNVIMVAKRMDVDEISPVQFQIVVSVMKSLSARNVQSGGAPVLPESYFGGRCDGCDEQSGGARGLSMVNTKDIVKFLTSVSKYSKYSVDKDAVRLIQSSINSNLTILFEHIGKSKTISPKHLVTALKKTHPFIDPRE